MSEFLGSRISLISKSDIRYSGILHEINSEESTVSLENVRSFGTEGRKGKPEEEIAPSDQVYEYIVFRGSDVKDLRIEKGPDASKENEPPKVPDDPAIVGARTRPGGNAAPGPNNQQGFGQNPYPNNFYPPPPGPWGRGGPGPGPGPQFGGMPYPPPPGWFPPGQGFPPGGPGPWNNFGYPPGPPGPPGVPTQGARGTPQQDKPAPIGAGADKQKAVPGDVPSEPKSLSGTSLSNQTTGAPTPPVGSKPSAQEVKATAESLAKAGPDAGKSVPTGPKNAKVTPAVPAFPVAPAFPKVASQNNAAAAAAVVKPNDQQSADNSNAALRDATQAAKAAVAVAMANLANPQAAQAPSNGSAVDNLTKKVNEMRVNASPRGSGSRGRGRGGAGRTPNKIDVPDADFDFASSNAKFNKQEIVKEAIAGSPLGEAPNGSTPEPQATATSEGDPPVAYNKSKSFFDNISSESRERSENQGQKPGGREWRGEEIRKNVETFGQGSVDGGYGRGYRGRGRGRGRGGPRGRGNYGSQQGGGRGGYRVREATASQ